MEKRQEGFQSERIGLRIHERKQVGKAKNRLPKHIVRKYDWSYDLAKSGVLCCVWGAGML